MRDNRHQLGAATAVLALWNDVDPDVDAVYNEWHGVEHVPERLTVPGISWARRFGRAAGEPASAGEPPRYLTLYGLRDVDVLASAPYLRLLAEPTPMSRRMRPELKNLSRWVCRIERMSGLLDASALGVWTWPLAEDIESRCGEARSVLGGDIEGELLAQRIPDAKPLPWLSGAGASNAAPVSGDWLLCVAASTDHQTLRTSQRSSSQTGPAGFSAYAALR